MKNLLFLAILCISLSSTVSFASDGLTKEVAQDLEIDLVDQYELVDELSVNQEIDFNKQINQSTDYVLINKLTNGFYIDFVDKIYENLKIDYYNHINQSTSDFFIKNKQTLKQKNIENTVLVYNINVNHTTSLVGGSSYRLNAPIGSVVKDTEIYVLIRTTEQDGESLGNIPDDVNEIKENLNKVSEKTNIITANVQTN